MAKFKLVLIQISYKLFIILITQTYLMNQKKLHIKTKIKNSMHGSVNTSQKLNSSIHFSKSVLATPEVELKYSKTNSNKITSPANEPEYEEELQRQSTQNIQQIIEDSNILAGEQQVSERNNYRDANKPDKSSGSKQHTVFSDKDLRTLPNMGTLGSTKNQNQPATVQNGQGLSTYREEGLAEAPPPFSLGSQGAVSSNQYHTEFLHTPQNAAHQANNPRVRQVVAKSGGISSTIAYPSGAAVFNSRPSVSSHQDSRQNAFAYSSARYGGEYGQRPMNVFSNAPLTDLNFRSAQSMMKNPKDVIGQAKTQHSRAQMMQQLADFRKPKASGSRASHLGARRSYESFQESKRQTRSAVKKQMTNADLRNFTGHIDTDLHRLANDIFSKGLKPPKSSQYYQNEYAYPQIGNFTGPIQKEQVDKSLMAMPSRLSESNPDLNSGQLSESRPEFTNERILQQDDPSTAQAMSPQDAYSLFNPNQPQDQIKNTLLQFSQQLSQQDFDALIQQTHAQNLKLQKIMEAEAAKSNLNPKSVQKSQTQKLTQNLSPADGLLPADERNMVGIANLVQSKLNPNNNYNVEAQKQNLLDKLQKASTLETAQLLHDQLANTQNSLNIPHSLNTNSANYLHRGVPRTQNSVLDSQQDEFGAESPFYGVNAQKGMHGGLIYVDESNQFTTGPRRENPYSSSQSPKNLATQNFAGIATLDPTESNLIDTRVWRKRPETANIRGERGQLNQGMASSASYANKALQQQAASRVALENYQIPTKQDITGNRPISSLTYASQNTKSSYSKNLRQRNMLERENAQTQSMRQTQANFMSNRDISGAQTNQFSTYTTKAMIMKQLADKSGRNKLGSGHPTLRSTYANLHNTGPSIKVIHTVSGTSLLQDTISRQDKNQDSKLRKKERQRPKSGHPVNRIQTVSSVSNYAPQKQATMSITPSRLENKFDQTSKASKNKPLMRTIKSYQRRPASAKITSNNFKRKNRSGKMNEYHQEYHDFGESGEARQMPGTQNSKYISIQSHEIEMLDNNHYAGTIDPTQDGSPDDGSTIEMAPRRISSRQSLTVKLRPKSAMPKGLMKSKQVSFVDDGRRRSIKKQSTNYNPYSNEFGSDQKLHLSKTYKPKIMRKLESKDSQSSLKIKISDKNLLTSKTVDLSPVASLSPSIGSKEGSSKLDHGLSVTKITTSLNTPKTQEVPKPKPKKSLGRKKIAKLSNFEGSPFFELEPTLSLDHGPNCQEKVYNQLQLSYIKDTETGGMKDYAEAKCILNIPKLVKIKKKKKIQEKSKVMRMLNRPEPGSTVGPSIETTQLQTPEEGSEYTITEGDEESSESKSRGSTDTLESCRSHDHVPEEKTNQGPGAPEPEHQEWSLPVRFIIKQSNVVVGKDFKKPEKLEIYASQNTLDPGPKSAGSIAIKGIQHSTMSFNVKEKANYDKEFGTNQVYQFIFGKEFFDLLNEAQRQERAGMNEDDDDDDDDNRKKKPVKKIESVEDALDVKYRNQIFITIRGQKDCELDVAAQLTLQPKKQDPHELALKLAQKKKKKVDYELIERLDKQLGQYFDENQPIGEANYIKENIKFADTAPTFPEKQHLKSIMNGKLAQKQQQSKSYKEQVDIDFRAASQLGLQRWDRYRQTREDYIDKAVMLIKGQGRAKFIVSLMMQHLIISKFCHNFTLWQEAAIQKLNNLFLAIKFKVRFRYRFCKKYGWSQHHRMRKDLVRHFTLFAATFGESRAEKAKRLVTGCLVKQSTITVLSEKFREFVKSGYQLQAAIRRAKSNSAFRYAFLAVKVAKEVRYLRWIYEKKLKTSKSQKQTKEINNILNKLHDLEEEGLGDPGASPEGRKKIDLYTERMRAEYILDYSIWRFTRIGFKMEQMEEAAVGTSVNVYQNPIFTRLITEKKRIFQRLKDWLVTTTKLGEQIFGGTELVDQDKLFIVDDEGFARDVLGKMPENNDDLASVSGTMIRKQSILGAKKGGKSKKAGGKGKKGRSGLGRSESIMKAQSFAHQEMQAELVQLILLDDPNGGRELTQEEEVHREKMLDPYLQMGSAFPTYSLFTSRENVQRLVVKAAGISSS